MIAIVKVLATVTRHAARRRRAIVAKKLSRSTGVQLTKPSIVGRSAVGTSSSLDTPARTAHLSRGGRRLVNVTSRSVRIVPAAWGTHRFGFAERLSERHCGRTGRVQQRLTGMNGTRLAAGPGSVKSHSETGVWSRWN